MSQTTKSPTLSRVKILVVWPRFLSNYTLVADQEIILMIMMKIKTKLIHMKT